MLVAVSKAEHRTGVPPALFIEHVAAFPCTDLRTLDNLWAWASGGRFGFSTQLGI